MSKDHAYYLIWSGSLNLGDTPGVFMDAQFAGLLLQIPLTLTFVPEDEQPIRFLLRTTDVEVFNDRPHPVFWDWEPGQPFPPVVGYINDVEMLPGEPEYHVLEIPHASATPGMHTLTIQVNAEVTAGLRDDFVLKRIEAHESIGARIGW